MTNKHCKRCENFDKCYRPLYDYDLYYTSSQIVQDATIKRELCINNDKDNFQRKVWATR